MNIKNLLIAIAQFIYAIFVFVGITSCIAACTVSIIVFITDLISKGSIDLSNQIYAFTACLIVVNLVIHMIIFYTKKNH